MVLLSLPEDCAIRILSTLTASKLILLPSTTRTLRAFFDNERLWRAVAGRRGSPDDTCASNVRWTAVRARLLGRDLQLAAYRLDPDSWLSCSWRSSDKHVAIRLSSLLRSFSSGRVLWHSTHVSWPVAALTIGSSLHLHRLSPGLACPLCEVNGLGGQKVKQFVYSDDTGRVAISATRGRGLCELVQVLDTRCSPAMRVWSQTFETGTGGILGFSSEGQVLVIGVPKEGSKAVQLRLLFLVEGVRGMLTTYSSQVVSPGHGANITVSAAALTKTALEYGLSSGPILTLSLDADVHHSPQVRTKLFKACHGIHRGRDQSVVAFGSVDSMHQRAVGWLGCSNQDLVTASLKTASHIVAATLLPDHVLAVMTTEGSLSLHCCGRVLHHVWSHPVGNVERAVLAYNQDRDALMLLASATGLENDPYRRCVMFEVQKGVALLCDNCKSSVLCGRTAMLSERPCIDDVLCVPHKCYNCRRML